jgi:hypothetical protein
MAEHYATWLTKKATARALRVSTKTLERMLQDGATIRQARWQRDGRGPKLAVYHPGDVAAAVRARGAFVLPAEGASTGLALPAAGAPVEELLRGVLTALATSATVSQTVSQTPKTQYVPLAEAVALSGLSEATLRRRVREGLVSWERTGRQLVILRADVEHRPAGE